MSDRTAAPRITALDLDAYLGRIGYGRSHEPTLATLSALQASHLAAIPFENVDVRLGRPISLEPADLEKKIVMSRRGGYCFEQNTLFATVLRQLGFAVSTLEARVRPADVPGPLPRTHMLLEVECESSSWLADVGFGGDGPLHPVPLDGRESEQPGATYRVLIEPGEVHVLQLRQREEWRDLYAFTRVPALPVDFRVANHFTSTHMQSIFLRTLTVQRSEPEIRHILRGRIYTRRRPEGDEVEEIRDEEIPSLLAEVFALPLEPSLVMQALGLPPD